jgi:hypothetical protein
MNESQVLECAVELLVWMSWVLKREYTLTI